MWFSGSNTFDSKEGKELHSAITQLGIILNMPIGSTLVDMYATCWSLSDANKLFDGLRSLKVGADHMALHEDMLIHAEIMDWGIQNDLYTIMLCLSFTLNVENRGCLVIVLQILHSRCGHHSRLIQVSRLMWFFILWKASSFVYPKRETWKGLVYWNKLDKYVH